jgi:hypothetical protein
MTQTPVEARALPGLRKGRVEFLDVPAQNYLVLDGEGDTDDPPFAAASRALHSVSFAAQFLVRQGGAAAPRVMSLEALWWTDDPAQGDLVAAVALGVADLGRGTRATLRWRAMIGQPEPVDAAIVRRAVDQVARREIPDLDKVRFERWEEGRVAQVLHLGPGAGDGPSVAALHHAIEESGHRPRGRHHQIYLTDPLRTAPSRLRTLLRQPVD